MHFNRNKGMVYILINHIQGIWNEDNLFGGASGVNKYSNDF